MRASGPSIENLFQPNTRRTDESDTPENRPWGHFSTIRNCPYYKLKVLQVKPGHRLSLQLHHHREEHWIITQGEALVTVDERSWKAAAGAYIHVPLGARHRIANPGEGELELIEVQRGDSFSEEDIVRLEDDYERVNAQSSIWGDQA